MCEMVHRENDLKRTYTYQVKLTFENYIKRVFIYLEQA